MVRAGFKNERVPVFREVLEWARGRTPVVIEIKQGPIFYDGIEQRILTELDARRCAIR